MPTLDRGLLLALLLTPACGPKPTPAAEPPSTTVVPPAAVPGDSGEAVASPPPSASPEPSASPQTDVPRPGMSWKTVDSGVAVPDEWRTCASEGDCALVVTTCCDQCNGGKAVAIAAAHKRDAEAKYSKQCPGIACTMRGCFTRAACEAGRCVMQWATAGH